MKTRQTVLGNIGKLGFVAALAGAMMAAVCSSASASIVYDSSIVSLGQGFGAVPRMLTVQATGPGDEIGGVRIENACDGNTGGVLVIGQCSGVDAAFLPNGYIVQNSDDSVNGGKDALVTLSSVGIVDASQIILVYNPSQEGNDPSTDIIDISLKFYGVNDQFLFSIDGGCGTTCVYGAGDPLYFGDTGLNLGNGGTGFGLRIDAAQVAYVNAQCGLNMVNCKTMALEVTIWNANDGPDSFLLYTPSQVNVPEPATFLLFGMGLAGLGVAARRRRKAAAAV